jgi:hypothetical protein
VRAALDVLLGDLLAEETGITDVCIVAAEAQVPLLRACVSAARIPDGRVAFAVQPSAAGFGDAVLCAEDFVGDEPHRAWPIPAAVDRPEPITRRTMFVGDAVAACDTLTGEGIGQALQTGALAAEAIVAAGPHGGDATNDYARRLSSSLLADHRMSQLLVRGLSGTRGANAAIAAAGATGWTRRNFARWLFEDYPRAVVATPRRWRSGVFTGPGAFQDQSALR